MSTQLEFLQQGVTDADVDALRGWLASHDWQTRRQLASGLGWSERRIRFVAEAMGVEIVRGQRGFKLTSKITRDDLPAVLQAGQASISQGKGMINYGMQLLHKVHEVVG